MISQTLQNCRDRKWNGDKTYVGSCSTKEIIDFRLELSNVKCTSLHCGLSILGTKVPEAKEGTASERVQDESMHTEANEGTASITSKHFNQRTNLYHLIHTASSPRSPGSPASTPSSVTCKGYAALFSYWSR